MATKAEIQALIDEITTGANYRAEQMRPLLTAMLDYSKPYKVYTALLTQTGTDAPVATVLENTLGGTVVWGYTVTGEYTATLSGGFTLNKTFIVMGNTFDSVNSTLMLTGILALNADGFQLNTARIDDGMLVDNQLLNTAIEIRVYD
jgi:hypothetical protein